MAKCKLKKGDKVVVISGTMKDESGPVHEIDRKKQRVRIEGVSLGKKKTLKKSMQNPQGGLVDRHEWIHISNVMLQEKYDERRKAGKGA
ncbi:50S ribosomal protein L24 [bacterium M21]|nr:50S ribosomal protein L24 [bacterium M21]